MARAALQWSVNEAGHKADISYRTILRFENEQREIKPELIAAIRRAYEKAGVRFAEDGGVYPPKSES